MTPIQPYRLCFGSKLPPAAAAALVDADGEATSSLYKLWGTKLASFANSTLHAQTQTDNGRGIGEGGGGVRLLVNVASDEYSKAVLAHAATHFDEDVTVVTCVFKHQGR